MSLPECRVAIQTLARMLVDRGRIEDPIQVMEAVEATGLEFACKYGMFCLGAAAQRRLTLV